MLAISAVVPTYNVEQYIEETLLSLAEQTMPLSEILVIDDCSSDCTLEKVEVLRTAVDVPIVIIRHHKNKGAAIARNHGIAAAKGDWVLFMDADDVAESCLVEKEITYLLKLQETAADKWSAVYSAYLQINAEGIAISGSIRGQQLTPQNAFGCLLIRNLISTSGLLVKKTELVAVGGFRGEGLVEDWDLWLRLAQQKNGFAYIDQPLVKVRRHLSNTSKNLSFGLQRELKVLKFYEPEVIRQAIFARDLSNLQNVTDSVGILFKLGYWNEGYQKLRKEKEQSATLFFLQGLYWLWRKELTQAQFYLEKTLQNDENHGAAINDLGVVYAVDGDLETARKLWQKALQLFPGYMDVEANLKILGNTEIPQLANFRITWRELRPILLSYSE